MIKEDARRLLDFYPRIYYACHTRQVADKNTGITLTAKQASVLDHLDQDQAVTLFDLATHMGVTPSTMSLAVNRLLSLGYVHKEKDKQDARKTNLTLTQSGHRIRQSKSVLDIDSVHAVLARMSPADRKLALDGLKLLADAAEREMKHKSLEKSWHKRSHKKPKE